MTSSLVIVELAELRECWLRWGRMTSMWDIFQSCGLVDSEREQRRAAEIEREKIQTEEDRNVACNTFIYTRR